MLKLTLFCLLVIQAVSIQAKTMQDVIDDMAPLFSLYHNEVLKYETTLHNSEQNALIEMGNYLDKGWYEIKNKAKNFSINIENESKAIIAELGMTSHLDKIQHCITDMNTKSSRMENTIVAGADVCHASGGKNLKYSVDSVVIPMYNTLTSTHKSLEYIKEVCINNHPDQGLICIVSIVYRRWDPQIEEMETETQTTITDMKISTNHVMVNFDMCNEIVAQNLNEDKPILDDFRKCVQEVANNMY